MNSSKSGKCIKKKQSNKLLKNPIDDNICFNATSCKKQSKLNPNIDKNTSQNDKNEQLIENNDKKTTQSISIVTLVNNIAEPSFANKSNVEERKKSTFNKLEKEISQTSFHSATDSGSYIGMPENKMADSIKNQIENVKAKAKGPSFGEPFFVSNKTQEKTVVEKQPYSAIKIVKTEISVQTEPIIRKSATTVTGSKSLEITSERRPTYSDIFRLVENPTATEPPVSKKESYASSVVSYPATYLQETWNRKSKDESTKENTKPAKKKNFFAKCFGCQ